MIIVLLSLIRNDIKPLTCLLRVFSWQRHPHNNDVLPIVVCMRYHVLFTLAVFVYVFWCKTHTVLCLCFLFHGRVYPKLTVSLRCPFLIDPSLFSNVYLSINRDTECEYWYKNHTNTSLLLNSKRWSWVPNVNSCLTRFWQSLLSVFSFLAKLITFPGRTSVVLRLSSLS